MKNAQQMSSARELICRISLGIFFFFLIRIVCLQNENLVSRSAKTLLFIYLFIYLFFFFPRTSVE